jgi:RNA polymerase sigma-70 factor (ECF subfamily)
MGTIEIRSRLDSAMSLAGAGDLEATDADLVRAAVAGNDEAFHALVDRHAPSLFRSAQALSRNRQDAEDLLQDTFIAAHRGLKNFAGRSSIKTWLLRILTRKAFKALKRARSRPTVSLDVIDIPQAGPSRSIDQRLDVITVLRTLSEPHCQVLTLREIEGLSYDEIATVLGIPRGTVESRLYRARAEFKEKYLSR